MKKLFLALALVLQICNAETIATQPNVAGGMIVLTDVKCKTGKSMVAYGTTKDGQTSFGCWFLDDNFVFIRWDDGTVRTYPFDVWQMRDTQPTGRKSL